VHRGHEFDADRGGGTGWSHPSVRALSLFLFARLRCSACPSSSLRLSARSTSRTCRATTSCDSQDYRHLFAFPSRLALPLRLIRPVRIMLSTSTSLSLAAIAAFATQAAAHMSIWFVPPFSSS
jgi:hypothetical protein